MPETRQPLPMRRKLLFAAIPTLAALLIAEVVIRLQRGDLFANYRQIRLTMTRKGYPAQRHPTLGYVAAPGAHSDDNLWGTTVTIDDRGFRSNGQERPAGAAILAAGDSFTFGDEVDDRDTWPAALERQLGRPVYNAGVFGYGLDQSMLRAELELERLAPAVLIVSLIPNDLFRAELSRRYCEKPYFELDGDAGLILRNVPVPESSPNQLAFWKDLLGLSALADAILSKSAWKDWYFANDKDVRVLPRGTGAEVGKRLVTRVARRCAETDCRFLLVFQGRQHDDGSRALLEYALAHEIEVVDLIGQLEREASSDPTILDRLFGSHMNPTGNDWVATQLAGRLR